MPIKNILISGKANISEEAIEQQKGSIRIKHFKIWSSSYELENFKHDFSILDFSFQSSPQTILGIPIVDH